MLILSGTANVMTQLCVFIFKVIITNKERKKFPHYKMTWQGTDLTQQLTRNLLHSNKHISSATPDKCDNTPYNLFGLPTMGQNK